MRLRESWPALFRVTAGLYWLYFAARHWSGLEELRPVIQEGADLNPVPGLHELMVVVASPHWRTLAVAQVIAELLVAVCLVLGLAARRAALLGFLLAVYLALTAAYVMAPDSRWTLYLAVLVSAQLVVGGPGSPALGSARFVPSWLR